MEGERILHVHVHVSVYMYMYMAEHWTSNPVVMGSNPVRGSSVFFFTVCLRTMPYLVLPSFAYTCTRFDHVNMTCTLYMHVGRLWWLLL